MNLAGIIIAIIIIVLIILILKSYLTVSNTLQKFQDAKISSTISASSLATNGSNVPSSNFTYSIWFYVNDFNYRQGEPKIIFGRMSAPSNSTNSNTSISGVNGIDPCPVVVLGAVENNISAALSCYGGLNPTETPTDNNNNKIVNTCSVVNVPIQKWVNLIVSVYARTMDLYIDGKLAKTCLLPGIAAINNNSDVYLTPNGGFDGYTSNFEYYPNATNPQEAYNIYSKGYGGNAWTNFFNNYYMQISLVENGVTKSTVSI